MTIHIALYKWRATTTATDIQSIFDELENLSSKIPGILNITATENKSKYSDGLSHLIFVAVKDQAAIDTYRAHPDHQKIAKHIRSIEERGIGVDFEVKDF